MSRTSLSSELQWGQPVLTATLALAIAAVLTAAIAIGTSARAYMVRGIKAMAIGVLIAVATVAIEHACLRINFTASMPIGLYSLLPLPSGVERGMMVAACAPARAAHLGRRRGYLAGGPCPEDTELLLKYVEAIAGDEVEITSAGGFVNGCRVLHSQPASGDSSGRRLVSWPRGAYRLSAGQVWLYAPNDRSWDSRYWGPASVADLKAKAVPLLTALGSAGP
jgi:conjugative transfer signal peptidase TraF